ncbi:unnamed protein product [Microthlaspi erraticum]|uniref:Arabidopsis retrotransposon Orf1 C-terminal domain-containing protein n=1 Tax=Microthlaspi erraticum TaxID=1685480 RepID=A0A6D2KDP7_9BRAS|nr:unnamed protein product [Microthlaspi erraticum]
MPSLTSSSPTRSQLTTLGTKEEESLVLEGSSHLSCVLLEWEFQFKFTHPLVGPSKFLLPNPELTTVVRGENIDFRPPVYTLVGHEDDCEKRSLSSIELSLELRVELRIELNIRSRSADLGEPECYYFEEYEAPRMNPSVVAAHKRIGLLQRFNKWQGKAMEKMQKSMDKMVSKIKSLEKKVSGSSSKKKSKLPLSLGVGHSSPPKEGSPTRASQSLFFRAREGEDNTQRRRKTSKARRSSSTTGLDRVQTEETQLDRAEVELTWKSPCLKILDSNTIQPSIRTSLRLSGLPTTASSEHNSTKAKEATPTLKTEEEEERSHKLDRVSRTQLSGALLMAVSHLQTTT